MTDDPKNTGANDRRQVAGGEIYELDYFARKHGIDRETARKLIAEHGNDRRTLDAAAEASKG